MLGHQFHKQLKFFAVHRFADIRSPHVIHYHRGRQMGEEVPQFGQVGGFEIHHNMPAQRRDFVGDFQQFFLGSEVHQAFNKIKAHAAHTGFVQALQFFVADIAFYGGDAARQLARALQRIDQGAVVGAVAGGLHNHVARKTQMVAQCK